MDTQPLLRHRASLVVIHDMKLLVVWMKDPVLQKVYPFPPGGKVEANETPAAAAIRECQEETGYKAILAPIKPIRLLYPFRWGNQTYSCQTDFFKGSLTTPVPAKREHESSESIIKVGWIELNDIASQFDYHHGIRDVLLQLA